MKKIIASFIVFGFAIAMVACGAKKDEAAARAKADSTATADSIASVKFEAKAAEAAALVVKAKADSTMKADSIAAAMVAKPAKKK